MPESNVEFTKGGLRLSWPVVIVFMLGTLGGQTVLRRLIPDSGTADRIQIKDDVDKLKSQLDDVNEKLKTCQEIEDFLIRKSGLDKITPIPADHTRRLEIQ